MRHLQILAPLAFLATSALPAVAQLMQISPVTLDIPPGTASKVITLQTGLKEGVAVQVRVFRWTQAGGEDKLEKTEDVVVSPPMLTLKNGAPSTLRLVRVSQTPAHGEETYRVLIDQIPDRRNLQSGTVALIIRQSLPVFFAGDDAHPGQLTWKAVERKGKLVLEASNTGQKRVKLIKLAVTDGTSRDLVKNGGLAYVLGGQTKSWELSGAAPGKTLSIKAESDHGPLAATVIAGRS